jgi:hypothetical protein
VPVGVTGHRTQRPRGQVGPPGPRTTPSPTQLLTSSLDPGGERERGPIIRPLALAPLIAQLVGWRTSSSPHALLRLSTAQLVGCASAGESR